MPLTPADVANKLFSKAFRGYEMEEVDGFLDEVQAELARLLTDNQNLQQRLQQQPAAPAVPAAPAPVAPAPATGAYTVSAPATEESQEAALRTLLMAQRTADQTVAEARAEAEQKLAAAQDEANKLLGSAQFRASQLDQEISARTTAALGELEGRRRELESRIEDLRAFEREYRLRLKAYLESQLRDLDGREGAPAAPVTAAASTGAVRPPAPPRPAGPFAGQPQPSQPQQGQPQPGQQQGQPQQSAPQGYPPTGAVPVPVPVPAAPPVAPPQPAPQPPSYVLPDLADDLATGSHELDELGGGPRPSGRLQELFAEGDAHQPSGPPREAGAPVPTVTPPSLRAVPPLASTEPEPVGPFTVVRPTVRTEQVDDGPEPPAPSS